MKSFVSFVFSSFVLVAAVSTAVVVTGCKSSGDPSVSSDYRSQWTTVSTSTTATVDASKAVLTDLGLTDVQGSATNVDGIASGKKADGTIVHVNIKAADTGSRLEVTVGTVGDPKLGLEIAEKIKAKAEGK